MSENWYGKPRVPQSTSEELEQLLLSKLKRCQDEYCRTLWDLAWLCSHKGRQERACKYIRKLLAVADDLELTAACYLALGQFMEQTRDYDAACTYYAQAYALEPVDPHIAYFVHNNLGYCLNRLGRHEEAESYLRMAIQIDPSRQNAYKNLGISLESQQRFAEAAECYLQGIQADASDSRALWLLEELVSDHPEIAQCIPDLFLQLERCRAAVQAARFGSLTETNP
nr:tetratricopeptide repeat protein [Chloroflexota bacterium]